MDHILGFSMVTAHTHVCTKLFSNLNKNQRDQGSGIPYTISKYLCLHYVLSTWIHRMISNFLMQMEIVSGGLNYLLLGYVSVIFLCPIQPLPWIGSLKRAITMSLLFRLPDCEVALEWFPRDAVVRVMLALQQTGRFNTLWLAHLLQSRSTHATINCCTLTKGSPPKGQDHRKMVLEALPTHKQPHSSFSVPSSERHIVWDRDQDFSYSSSNH